MADADARPRGAVRSSGLAFGVLLAAVALVSVNLRPGASSVGPVLEELRTGLGMSAAVAGAVTGLPGLVLRPRRRRGGRPSPAGSG